MWRSPIETALCPKVWKQWKTNLDDFAAFAKTLTKHAGQMKNNNSYAFKWTFRSFSFAEMRNAGVKALQYDPSTPLHVVKTAFPDQLNWLGESLTLSIGEVMSDWGYHGPLEMFSVMLCVLGDAVIQDLDEARLQALRSRILQIRDATLKEHSYEGSPVLSIREADKQN